MRAVLVTLACLATLAAAVPEFEVSTFDVTTCLQTTTTYNRTTCTVCQEATRAACSTKDCPPEDGDEALTPDCKLCYEMTMVSAKNVARMVLDECKMCGVVVEATNILAKAKDAQADEVKATKECSKFCLIESCIRVPEEFGFVQAEALKCRTGVRAACEKLSTAEAVVA